MRRVLKDGYDYYTIYFFSNNFRSYNKSKASSLSLCLMA